MKTLRHEDVCTLLRNEEDKDILTRPLFDVNLRLCKTSSRYMAIVRECALYVQWLAMNERPGYKKPHGFSGANAGIPFNIIALEDGTIMLNPHITKTSGSRSGMSNCGSLLLDNPIKIRRFQYITVEFWDLNLQRQEWRGFYPTVQHEVDHNKGILITQRKWE